LEGSGRLLQIRRSDPRALEQLVWTVATDPVSFGSLLVSLPRRDESKIKAGALSLALLLLVIVPPGYLGFGAEPAKSGELKSYLGKLGYYAVPLDFHRDSLAVKTRLSGEKVALLINTGASWTVIDTYTARGWKTPEEMGVTLVDSAYGVLTNSSLSKRQLVVMPELRLGDAVFSNQPVVAAKVKLKSWDADGRLSCDFLARNHCILDFTIPRMLYVRQTAPDEQTRSALRQTMEQSGYRSVRLKLVQGAGLTCDLAISNSIVPMSLASG
jgi:hypothetical protein